MKYYCLIIGLFWMWISAAQTSRILKVYDQFNGVPVSRATCIILDAKDSTMILFGRTNTKGIITFNRPLPMDSLLFLILHYKYLETGIIKLNSLHDTFFMFPKNKVLSEVNIRTNKAVTLSGDTITYVADSFKLKPNATVEDLLKKLPGIQVDKDGTIKAQGERVTRILVDGDDFFGENAAIATKNLDAKMIDKVEIIDAQTKRSRSTGVDDGEKEKVINLKLKESAKKGFFGKIEAGATNTNRYLANGMGNIFSDESKSSVYGLTDNMNHSMSWNDRNDFGMGENWQYDEDLDVWINSDNISENDFGVIPRKVQAGAFLSQKFEDKRGRMALKYGYKGKTIKGTQKVNSTILYQDKEQNTFQNNQVDATNQSHLIGFDFDKPLDSFQTTKFSVQFSHAKSDYSSLQKNNMKENGNPINFNSLAATSNSERPNLDFTAGHEVKFKRPGRFLGVTAGYNMANTSADAITNNGAIFYNKDIDSFYTTNNLNLRTKLNNKSYKASFLYIEPIYKQNVLIELGASVLSNKYLSGRNTYTNNNVGKDYSIYLDSLSNNYDYNVNAYSQYFKLMYRKKKLSMDGGLKVQESLLNQVSIGRDSLYRTFINPLPFFRLDWKYKRNATFRFNFRTSIKPPSIDQIQPFSNNTNPFYIFEGNKQLIPATNYVFSLRNNFSQPIKGTSLWSSVNFKYIQNDIVSSLTIQNNGVRKQSYVQTNGNYSITANANYSFMWPLIGFEISPQCMISYSKTNSFTNNIENISKVFSISPGIEFDSDFDSLVSLNFSFNVNYVTGKNSNNFTQQNAQVFYTIGTEDEWQLPAGFRLETGFEWQIYPSSSAYATNNSVALLSADLKRNFLKNMLELKVGVFDILNQNKAINRTIRNNNIYESISDALTRYFMITATYRFKNKEKKEVMP